MTKPERACEQRRQPQSTQHSQRILSVVFSAGFAVSAVAVIERSMSILGQVGFDAPRFAKCRARHGIAANA
jgi:hypothetical protein